MRGFPAPPLKIKEPKTTSSVLTVPSYSAIPKYGDVFGGHYVPTKQNIPKLNVS